MRFNHCAYDLEYDQVVPRELLFWCFAQVQSIWLEYVLLLRLAIEMMCLGATE